jgi:predicted dehydrogenase
MAEKTKRAQVSVALVGMGQTWELNYRSAIQRLASRLSIRAICDCVHVRAAAVADEFGAAPVTSPWQLSQRSDIQAWIILDPDWYAAYPAEIANLAGRSVLLANPLWSQFTGIDRLFNHAVDSGETLMPAFPQRYAASTIRLRELMAAKLGRVQRIDVITSFESSEELEFSSNPSRESLIGLVDWCTYLVGRPYSSVRHIQSREGELIQLEFINRIEGPSKAVIATIRIASDAKVLQRKVECEHGSAILRGATEIAWQMGSETFHERLDNERSPCEIILDQFCRRATGGLVPVPSAKDALQAMSAVQRARESGPGT